MFNPPTAEIDRATEMVPGPLQSKKKKSQHLVLTEKDTCPGYRSVFPDYSASEETICEPTG